MILDEVLQESTYDTDSMVDMFVEGFLYALEMQENGEKASSMEELSYNLSEAANTAISELSEPYLRGKAEKASKSMMKHELKAREIESKRGSYDKARDLGTDELVKYGKRTDQMNLHKAAAAKRGGQMVRIMNHIAEKNKK